MKKSILTMLLILPLIAYGQDDPKYLKGAVPEIDGKVVFSTQLAVDGSKQAEIYETMKKWCEELTNRPEVIDRHTRLAYSNEEKGELIVNGEEWLVFSSSALSLDRSRMYYTLRLNCKDNMCSLELMRLRYWYDENRDGGIRYTAEEILTDQNALNKDQTKLVKVIGKFRRKTIDFKDELFTSASKAFGETTISAARIMTVQQPVPASSPKTPETTTEVPVKKYTTVAPPVETFATQTAQEQVVTFTLSKESQACELLENSETITLTLISPNGAVSLLEFKKNNTIESSDGKTCTFTGKVSNPNVK